MRCLTLADALASRGARCRFVSRRHEGNLFEAVRLRGHDLTELPLERTQIQSSARPQPLALAHAAWLGTDQVTDAQVTRAALGGERFDWLIVDHYALDATWERTVRGAFGHVLVIDDLADRVHDCELLLDQNLGRDASDYAARVPSTCRVLSGPQYALLRPQFAAWRESMLHRRQLSKGSLGQLLICLGGIDSRNATGAVLRALVANPRALPADCTITVVMGSQAPWLEDVRGLAKQLPWPTQVRVGVDNMAELMAGCDLAIGAAGATSWERCCLGLPALLLVLAENQKTIASELVTHGAALSVEPTHSEGFVFSLTQALTSAVSGSTLQRMSQAAASVVDGLGTDRVLRAIIDLTVQ